MILRSIAIRGVATVRHFRHVHKHFFPQKMSYWWKMKNNALHILIMFVLCLLYCTAGNRHKQNSWFCKEIREDNFRFWWRRVHENASQGMYMSKIEFFFLTARILQNQRMLCCGECFTIRNMYSLFLYMKCNSRKINRPTKNMTKIVTLLHF